MYMLATLQVRYGKTRQFYEILSHLVPMLEKKGWRLRGAWVNSVGTLNKVYDLWELPDSNAVQSVLAEIQRDPEFAKWADQLPDCLESEQLELMEKVPYSP